MEIRAWAHLNCGEIVPEWLHTKADEGDPEVVIRFADEDDKLKAELAEARKHLRVLALRIVPVDSQEQPLLATEASSQGLVIETKELRAALDYAGKMNQNKENDNGSETWT